MSSSCLGIALTLITVCAVALTTGTAAQTVSCTDIQYQGETIGAVCTDGFNAWAEYSKDLQVLVIWGEETVQIEVQEEASDEVEILTIIIPAVQITDES